jgi:putative ABC transport system substrate-binding protein
LGALGGFLADALSELGQFDEAIGHAEAAVRIAEAADHPFTLFWGVFDLGRAHIRRGDLPRATQSLERDLDLCRTWQIVVGRPIVAATLGAAYAVTGRADKALREALPHLSRIGLLVDVSDLSHEPALREIEAAGRILGVQLRPRVDVSNPAALAGAFATMTKAGSTAVFTIGGTTFYANRRLLAELALNSRLPMSCSAPEFVSTGCLMTYSANLADIFRRAAGYVDRILKGAKPADLPIEQPTKFDFVINLKTAKALGLTVPQPLILQADKVID